MLAVLLKTGKSVPSVLDADRHRTASSRLRGGPILAPVGGDRVAGRLHAACYKWGGRGGLARGVGCRRAACATATHSRVGQRIPRHRKSHGRSAALYDALPRRISWRDTFDLRESGAARSAVAVVLPRMRWHRDLVQLGVPSMSTVHPTVSGHDRPRPTKWPCDRWGIFLSLGGVSRPPLRP